MTQYTDDMLVYVDPNTRAVVGVVEWLPNGKPKRLAMQQMTVKDAPEQKDRRGRPRRQPKERYYPWCSYRTAKRVYRVEGKIFNAEEYTQTFDGALEKALQEPYWD